MRRQSPGKKCKRRDTTFILAGLGKKVAAPVHLAVRDGRSWPRPKSSERCRVTARNRRKPAILTGRESFGEMLPGFVALVRHVRRPAMPQVCSNSCHGV